jgi:hypothetical protein
MLKRSQPEKKKYLFRVPEEVAQFLVPVEEM